MKKTMLLTALVTLINTQVYADKTSHSKKPSQNNNASTQTQPASTPATAPAPSTQLAAVPQQATMPAVMNCDYKIPPQVTVIDKTIVIAWAEKAIVQAFDFDSKAIDAQLQRLQVCFTDQGWQGFNSALQKSGNLQAIKTQNLTVSSQLDGKLEMNDAKDNLWKVTAPLQVVYQNDKEKVTQLLTLNVTIGRKTTGDLGIMQIIASPRAQGANAAEAGTKAQPSTNPQPTAPVQPAANPQPNANAPQPATNVQQPATNVQQPNTNVQQPATNVQQPNTNVQPQNTNAPQQPTTNAQPAAAAQPNTTQPQNDDQATGLNMQPATGGAH